MSTLALALVAAAAAATPASGAYEQLKLAFVGGRVQGAFLDERVGNGTEAAPQFSCRFELTGAWRGDHADVLTGGLARARPTRGSRAGSPCEASSRRSACGTIPAAA